LRPVRDIIFEIENDVKGGENLSDAMAKHPKVFSAFYVNVVKAGEATGKLHDVLKYLADHAEQEYNLTFKVKGAFTYPTVIMALFLVVGAVVMIYVIPQLTAVIQESGGELPITTKILIGVSKFLKNWFWLVGLLIVGMVVGSMRFKKTEKGHRIFDIIKLKIPIFKSLFQKIYLARLAENLRTLVIGGIPILRALDISAIVIGNKIYEEIILKAKEQVKVGKTISSAFSDYPKQITPMFTQMVGVGEKTAELGTILEKVAYFYQQEVDRTVANMTQLIEPFMLLILGAGVAFLLSAVLMPIYNFAGSM
jgi:type IV pilus assembly protein PilC